MADRGFDIKDDLTLWGQYMILYSEGPYYIALFLPNNKLLVGICE